MNRWIRAGLTAFAVLGYVAQSAAQGGAGRMWNPATVETVSGEVVEVAKQPSPRGKGYGVHLVLKTKDAPKLVVHLGPAFYVEKQQVKIAAGDTVEVKGSRVTLKGEPVLLAAEVKKGDATLLLRDASGVPAWSGGGGGKRARRPPSGG